MSDSSQGEGWWLASDGKWYPPTSAPASPPPPSMGQVYNPATAAPTANEAVWSLVLGILSLVMCGFLAGIPAVILGNNAKRKIATSGGTMGGGGLATAGIVMGWISIGFTVAAIGIFVILIAVGSSSSSGALGL